MTTQTPRRSPAKKPASRADNVPPLMRIARPWITGIGALLMLGGAFYVAINLGFGRQLYAGTGMAVIGLLLSIVAQFRGLYTWADKDDAPVVEHADQAPPAASKAKPPRQRRRDRQQAEAPAFEIPSLKPSWSLGPEFRYIVTYMRWVAVEHPEVLAEMDTFWNTIDWDSDETDSDYRDAVEFLWEIARSMPSWDENATRDELLAGTVARDNAYAFVAELESYHSLAAAIGVLMLVRSNSRVTTEDFDVVIEPWTDLGMSYRLANVVFSLGPNDQYVTKDVEAAPAQARRAPGSAAPAVSVTDGTAAPSDDFEATIAAHTAAQQAIVPPAVDLPAAPREPEPAPAPARHVEADRDDVEDPDVELILHAAELVITSQFGSTSMLQRKQRIGFALAAKVMHRLHQYGVVGPKAADGGAREVMVGVDELADTLDFLNEQEAERRAGGSSR